MEMMTIRREDAADLPMLTSNELLIQVDLAAADNDRDRVALIGDMIIDRGERGCTVAQSWYR
jgi:hypothetical protein